MAMRDGYPYPTSPGVTAVMKGNPRAGTRPERAVRSLLHGRGLRFRKDFPVVAAGVKVRPDIVFTRRRVAVFIDGCWWHSCPEHGHKARSNTHYWGPKFERNKARDERANKALSEAGWQVLRFWEHEDYNAIADAIAAAVREQGLGSSS